MGEDALAVAHEAKNLALRAMTQVEMLQPQLANIGASISDMRRENTDQHRENARILGDGIREVHTRISSIKLSMSTDLEAVDKKLSDRQSAVTGSWAKYRDKAFWLLAAIAAGLLADKLGFHIPGTS